MKLTKTQKSIIRQLHLQGYWGKSGNLSVSQRRQHLQTLMKIGALDANCNPSTEAIESARYHI